SAAIDLVREGVGVRRLRDSSERIPASSDVADLIELRMSFDPGVVGVEPAPNRRGIATNSPRVQPPRYVAVSQQRILSILVIDDLRGRGQTLLSRDHAISARSGSQSEK